MFQLKFYDYSLLLLFLLLLYLLYLLYFIDTKPQKCCVLAPSKKYNYRRRYLAGKS